MQSSQNFFNSLTPPGKESFQGEMAPKVFRLYFWIKPVPINEPVRTTSFIYNSEEKTYPHLQIVLGKILFQAGGKKNMIQVGALRDRTSSRQCQSVEN